MPSVIKTYTEVDNTFINTLSEYNSALMAFDHLNIYNNVNKQQIDMRDIFVNNYLEIATENGKVRYVTNTVEDCKDYFIFFSKRYPHLISTDITPEIIAYLINDNTIIQVYDNIIINIINSNSFIKINTETYRIFGILMGKMSLRMFDYQSIEKIKDQLKDYLWKSPQLGAFFMVLFYRDNLVYLVLVYLNRH